MGLGIMGKEGRAAVRAADFAFSKFHYLQKVNLSSVPLTCTYITHKLSPKFFFLVTHTCAELNFFLVR